MLEHRAPLPLSATHASLVCFESGGLRVTQLSARGLLLVQSRVPYEQLNARLRPLLGVDLPRDAQGSRHHHESALPEITESAVQAALWLAPGQWLLELPCSLVLQLLNRIDEALREMPPSAPTAVLDFSDALCHLEVSGPQMTAALARSCSLDLSLSSFPVDRVARTVIAEVGTVLWRLEAQRCRCLIERGLAQHFLEWLRQW